MAPFGGTRPVLTPNPLAIGFPTDGDPILIDLSASITTATMTRSLAAKGERYPEKWALTATGEPTYDPREVTVGGGTLMPLDGARKGYKGFGLALMVDVLSQGLADFGRENPPGPMSLAVFLRVIDPEAFGGRAAFAGHASFTAAACRAVPPGPGVTSVRVRWSWRFSLPARPSSASLGRSTHPDENTIRLATCSIPPSSPAGRADTPPRCRRRALRPVPNGQVAARLHPRSISPARSPTC